LTDQVEFDVAKQPSFDERWNAIFEHGIRYVAIQKPTHAKFIELLDPTKAPTWLDVQMEFAGTDMPIMHIRSKDPTRHPSYGCSQAKKQVWRVTSQP